MSYNIKVQKFNSREINEIPYEELIELIKSLSTEEKIELANSIGYPVFTRMCMGTLKHDFVLLQDGAAIIIENEKGKYYYKVEQTEINGAYLVDVKT